MSHLLKFVRLQRKGTVNIENNVGRRRITSAESEFPEMLNKHDAKKKKGRSFGIRWVHQDAVEGRWWESVANRNPSYYANVKTNILVFY